MSKGFSERNPVTIAVVGILALVLIAAATYFADDLPIVGGGSTYTAYFTGAGGLKDGDDVRIAGVEIGHIVSIDLAGAKVRVQFKAKDAWIGDRSRAAIEIKTLLGQEFINIDPRGQHALDPDTSIPVTRTSTPLDVSAALSGLSDTVGSINTTRLAQSFNTLTATFKNTPKSLRSALTGLSSLSRTISSRDDQLRTLAKNTNALTGTVAGSNKQFAKLINDGALLLQELQLRSDAITSLLAGTRKFSTQLAGLVTDNTATLKPALDQLSRVTTILNQNQSNLTEALRLIGPYYTLLNNAAGNGPWIDIYICGLFDIHGSPDLASASRRDCTPRSSR